MISIPQAGCNEQSKSKTGDDADTGRSVFRNDHAGSDGVERLRNMFSFTPKQTLAAYEERGPNHDQVDD
jgi:hypothetical protein